MSDDDFGEPMCASEVKQCPFCGELPRIVPWHGGGPRKRMVMCRSDNCHVGPMVTGPSRKTAVKRWNTRNG